jgi:hypothetical protein
MVVSDSPILQGVSRQFCQSLVNGKCFQNFHFAAMTRPLRLVTGWLRGKPYVVWQAGAATFANGVARTVKAARRGARYGSNQMLTLAAHAAAMNSVTEPDRKKVRGRQKGCVKTGGRAKGGLNRVTVLLKDAILLGAGDAGGGGKDGLRRYLAQQAAANPVAYLNLLAKVLPTQLTDAAGSDLIPTVVFRTTYEAGVEPMRDVTPAPKLLGD